MPLSHYRYIMRRSVYRSRAMSLTVMSSTFTYLMVKYFSGTSTSVEPMYFPGSPMI